MSYVLGPREEVKRFKSGLSAVFLLGLSLLGVGGVRQSRQDAGAPVPDSESRVWYN
jgi:hypothetical protein